ncbi:MAG: polysaccharide deacetylase family protein [Hamadaea sp.]|nr:polysaccharide deacetylase family protein [Hamadaea sp.]
MVFVRGTNNGLYANSNATGWQPLGGALIDAPAASANSTGGVDVVVRGTDRALWTRAFRSGTWSASYQRAWAPSAPTPPPASRLGTDWTRIPTSSKVIALTFDAGGNDRGLASIRRTLQLKNVPATFFLTGAWTRSFPTRANEVAVAGFRVGNHTDTHPHLPALTTDAAVRAQINTAEEAILRGTGADPRPLFRFPFGDVNSRVLGIVNDEGYVAVRWTVDSLGWQGTSGGTVQQVVDRVLAGAQPGAIVLMHVGSNPDDGTTFDAAALPQIIDGFRARGYTFVTLNALVR